MAPGWNHELGIGREAASVDRKKGGAQPGGGGKTEDGGPAPAGLWLSTRRDAQLHLGASQEGRGHLCTLAASPPAPAASPVLCGSPGATRPLPQLSAFRFLALPSGTSLQVPRPRGQGMRRGGRTGGTGRGAAKCTRTCTTRMQTPTPTRESPSCPPAQAAALQGRVRWQDHLTT